MRWARVRMNALPFLLPASRLWREGHALTALPLETTIIAAVSDDDALDHAEFRGDVVGVVVRRFDRFLQARRSGARIRKRRPRELADGELGARRSTRAAQIRLDPVTRFPGLLDAQAAIIIGAAAHSHFLGDRAPASIGTGTDVTILRRSHSRPRVTRIVTFGPRQARTKAVMPSLWRSLSFPLRRRRLPQTFSLSPDCF